MSRVPDTDSNPVQFDAIIVGAGFAGLYALHRLRGLGLRTRLYEAGSDVGGTWFWNRYPGARCDVESLDYSFSFSDEIQQQWRWPDKYAVQPDILAYINHVADRFDLRRDMQFNTRIVAQAYDDGTGRWTIATDKGEKLSAQFCIMATGNLSTPRVPGIKGLLQFTRKWYHSAMWPSEGADFTGKRVALIGTGASGVQLVPKIAAQAEHLYVLQRTANFSVPAQNGPVDDAMDRDHKTNYAHRRKEALGMAFGMFGFPVPTKSALQVTPEERQRTYEERWRQGGSINFLSAYTDLLTSEEANETAAEFVRSKIRIIVRDPAVAEKLCPHDHPIGSKRLCLDTSYYETFNQPNVTLIDLRRDPLEEITAHGVRTRSAEHAVDSLVFATGFDAITGSLLAIDIRGQGGKALAEKWKHGPLMYLGLMVAGFPNMFVITGPGSPSVKSNMVCSIEQHVEFITSCIRFLRERDLSRIEPDEEFEREWVAHVNEVADRTLYPKADSWYTGANIPGKPRIFMPYVGGIPAYRKKCDEVVANGYRGFRLS